MKKKIKKKDYTFLTKTAAIAKNVLGLTFETYGYDYLTYYLYQWQLEITKHADAEILFDKLDEILENYSTNELMNPSCIIKGIGKNRYVRFLGLFIFLLMLVKYSWLVYGKAIQEKKENAWDMDTSSEDYLLLTELIRGTDVQLLQQTLGEALILTTGEDYYSRFLSRLNVPADIAEKELLEMENDPDMFVHKNEMVLFAAFRSFIDSSFFLFKETDRRI